MRKGKAIEPKFAVVLALAIVLVLIWYGYKAEWFKDIGVENTGAVAAVSSTSGSKLVSGAKAISDSTSSPQPVIAVTSYPTFEMKYDSVGQENNLVVKASYSVTAKNGKIYTPAAWAVLNVHNTLDQDAGAATKVEITALDTVATNSCYWQGVLSACYVIPEGKTIRFTAKQTYNPRIMFGGVYSAKLTDLYFLPGTNGQLYYKPFPSQTSKLNTITIVGEKSPYVYTTVVETQSSQQFTIKGIRLTGTSPFIEGNSTPENVIGRSDTEMTLAIKTTPGVYTLYLNHPTYGKSNKIQLIVKRIGYPEVTLVSSNASINVEDGNDNDIGVFTIRYVVEAIGGPIYVSKNAKAIASTSPTTVSDGKGVLFLIADSGMPVTTGLTQLVTFTTSGGASEVKNGVYLEEGESTDMTLTVLRTNLGQSTDDGLYQVLLKGIGWATTDTPIFNIYQPKGIENYKTPPINLN